MPSSIYILYSVAFLDLLAVGAVISLIPGHVLQLGGSHLAVGAAGSVYSGFQLVSGPLIGSLSDIKGRKNVMILTLLVSGSAYFLMGLTNSITIILLTRAVVGIFKQTQMLTRALVADYEKNQQKQSEIYGKMAAISGAGMTFGPSIGGHIAEDFPQYGFQIVIVMVSLIFILNAAVKWEINVIFPYQNSSLMIFCTMPSSRYYVEWTQGNYLIRDKDMLMQDEGLVLLLPNVKPVRRKPNRPRESENILHNAKSSLKQSVVELYQIQWSEYWNVFLLKFLMSFAMGVYFSNYTIYLSSEYGLSKKYVGYIISFQGVVGVLSSYFISYINTFYANDEDFSLRNLHVFVILTISLAGLILSFNVYMFIFWLIPFAVGNAVGRLTSLEIVLRKSQGKHRGTFIGASNSVRSLSGVVSPMVAGLIGQYVGIPQVNYASLLTTIVGVVISYLIRSTKQKKD